MYALRSDGTLIAQTGAGKQAFVSGSLLHRVCCAEKGSFVLRPYNPYKDAIGLRRSVLTIDRDGEVIFRGQAVDKQEYGVGYVQYTILGDLSFLRDGLIGPFSFTGSAYSLISSVLTSYNAQVAAARQIGIGRIAKTGLGVSMSYSQTDSRSAWDIITGLTDAYGGYLCLRTDSDGSRVLDWLDDSGHFATQPIVWGDNLLSLTVREDATKIANSIQATDGDALDVLVEDADSIARYGRVRIARRYTASTSTELRALAQADLEAGRAAALQISGQALDKWARGFEPFRAGDFAHTVSGLHRIDEWILISELKRDLTRPSYVQVTLGQMPQSIERTERSGVINTWIAGRSGRTPATQYAIDANGAHAVDANGAYAVAEGE